MYRLYKELTPDGEQVLIAEVDDEELEDVRKKALADDSDAKLIIERFEGGSSAHVETFDASE